MSEYYTITPGYFENIPKKIIAAGVLFYNNSGELLILKPSYKSGWTIPGGVVDFCETPIAGAIREVQEEIGLYKPDLILRCVDYSEKENPRRDSMQFLFHGGVLNEKEIQDIKLQKDEIEDFQFLPLNEVITKLTGSLGKRVQMACENKNEYAFYLESGNFPVYGEAK